MPLTCFGMRHQIAHEEVLDDRTDAAWNANKTPQGQNSRWLFVTAIRVVVVLGRSTLRTCCAGACRVCRLSRADDERFMRTVCSFRTLAVKRCARCVCVGRLLLFAQWLLGVAATSAIEWAFGPAACDRPRSVRAVRGRAEPVFHGTGRMAENVRARPEAEADAKAVLWSGQAAEHDAVHAHAL